MDTNSNTTALNCPPLCLFVDEPHRHDVDIDGEGRVLVDHSIDFGPHVWASMRVDVRDDDRIMSTMVGISDVDSAESDLPYNPEALRKFAAAVMDAADWLEARQA
ncbi:hypothetical protein [Nocardioides sp.]|uniref:hypothetical protein n=1 Tax=Nocardioides sp. TaxID=35761 RepID=UPI0035168A2D